MSIDFPKEEERILAHWKEIDAFLRQVELVREQLLSPKYNQDTRHAEPIGSIMHPLLNTTNSPAIVQRQATVHILRWAALRDGHAPLWPSPGLDHQGHYPPLLVNEGTLC